MKRIIWFALLVLLSVTQAQAQVNEQLLLARQFLTNGEATKALEIYQKLYKQDNDAYYSQYISALTELKKFDEAEDVAKKMARKYPKVARYTIALGTVYAQNGNTEKAKALYDDLIKNLPANQLDISDLAMQFYQFSNAEYAIKVFQAGRKKLNNDALFANELITLYRFKRDKANLTEEYLNFLPNNPGFINQAQYTLSTLYEGAADYDMLRMALLKRIQKDPQQVIYVTLLTWQFLQQKEFDQALNQSLALSRRTNSDGSDIYDLCRTLIANQAYDTAIRGYEYIVSKGKENPLYVTAKIELINTKNLKVTTGKYTPADLLSLEKDYQDSLIEFGKKPGTAFAMQRLANLQAFKLHKLSDAQKVLEDAVNIPGLQPELLAACKLDLGDVYLLNGQPWEATLLYGQVEKEFPNTNMGQDAKYRNAKFAYYTGDFKWAKAQLDVLKAAVTQLIANDALNLSLLLMDNMATDSTGEALKMYSRADMKIFAQESEKAMLILDSIDVKFPNNTLQDDISMSKARISIQQKNYAEAVTLLKKIAETHPTELWADDAVYMLGDIYENQLNDKDQAKNYFQKIITDYPGSLWINDARKRFRILRGDKSDGVL